jgi:hypothetical protein
MLSAARHPLKNTYSVEVSGWDDSQAFFVERAELSWDEQMGKHLTLSHQLCPGTMIFVRLLQATAPERTFPVAYHAEPLTTTPDGQQKFRVTRMEPRNATRREG